MLYPVPEQAREEEVHIKGKSTGLENIVKFMV